MQMKPALFLILLFIVTNNSDVKSIIPGKSPNENREFQAMILPNGMTVLLISDRQIEKSACSISIGVGSLYNPQNSLGLAHFLEHMVFRGSKKYPNQNQFTSFVSQNAGYFNAFTTDRETNFFLEIKNEYLGQAIDRIFNFFTNSLLKQESIQKQKQAVQNQYQLLKSRDSIKLFEMIKMFAQPPMSRFSAGNNETLSHPQIRQDLINFYNKYYSADIMKVAICSNQTIQQMRLKYIPFLQTIPNKQTKHLLTRSSLDFNIDNLQKFVQFQTVSDEHVMQFAWPVQNVQQHYSKHVDEYLGHMLGHEGKHSLLEFLKDKKYASVTQSFSYNTQTQSLIVLIVKLTSLGNQNYQQVYNIVMDYIDNMKPLEAFYQQLFEKNKINFEYLQKSKAIDLVTALSSKMQKIPLNHLLNSSIVFDSFKQSQVLIQKIINSLKESKMILTKSSKAQIENPKIQKFFSIKYKILDFPVRKQMIKSWPTLKKNPYVPVNTTLIKFSEKLDTVPKLLKQDVYFLQDSSFRVCKGSIQIRVFSSEDINFLTFYAAYLNLLLKQVTYPAEMFFSAISYIATDCLVIKVEGFTDTVVKLINNMVDFLFFAHFGKKSLDLFQVVLNQLKQSQKNFYNKDSYWIANNLFNIIINKSLKPIEQSIKQYQNYNYKNIMERINKFWSFNYIKWAIIGNFDKEVIKKLIDVTELKIKGVRKNVVPQRHNSLKLNKNIVSQYIIQVKDTTTSCAFVYYEVGPYTDLLYYQLVIMKLMIDEPYLNLLRTQKKMAYLLGTQITNTRGILGIKFFLVSSTNDPKNISQQIKKFVNSFSDSISAENISQSTNQRFQKAKQSLRTSLKQPIKSLSQLISFILSEITLKTYNFNRRNQQNINKILNQITLTDLGQILNRMKQNTVQIYVVSQNHLQKYRKNNVMAQNIEQIKNNSEYWEDFYY